MKVRMCLTLIWVDVSLLGIKRCASAIFIWKSRTKVDFQMTQFKIMMSFSIKNVLHWKPFVSKLNGKKMISEIIKFGAVSLFRASSFERKFYYFLDAESFINYRFHLTYRVRHFFAKNKVVWREMSKFYKQRLLLGCLKYWLNIFVSTWGMGAINYFSYQHRHEYLISQSYSEPYWILK